MKKYFCFCSLLMLIVTTGCLQDQSQAQIPLDLLKGPNVTLQSGALSLRFVSARAWTFDELRYDGNLLNNPTSLSGLVLNFGGALFLGSGHHQAGAEKVLSIQLTVDGKGIDQAQLLKGGNFNGKSIELIKTSNLVSANVEPASITPLKSVIRLNNGVLECEQFLTPDEDTDISKLYAFMFSWTTQTTGWMAKTVEGELREGEFSHGPSELLDNVQWTSIYDPVFKTATVTVFDKDSRNGAGVRHFYWNAKRYHKQYYQPVKNVTLKKGTTYHWGVKVLFTTADEKHWKQKVKELAETALVQ